MVGLLDLAAPGEESKSESDKAICVQHDSPRQGRDQNGKVNGTWEEELSSQRKVVIPSSPEADQSPEKQKGL